MNIGWMKMDKVKVRVITNSDELGRRMDEYKQNGQLKQLEPTMVTALGDELMMKNLTIQKLARVTGDMTVEEVNENGDHEDELIGVEAWDDVTGLLLDPREVQRARMKELHYIHEKNVWAKMPRSEAMKKGYKVVKGRWIDINKGDLTNWKYRSRYVAKEFNTGDLDGLFASTPPWRR